MRQCSDKGICHCYLYQSKHRLGIQARTIPQSAKGCHRIYILMKQHALYVSMMEKLLINWQRRPWEPVGLWRQKLMSSRNIFADGESWKRASSTHKTFLLVKFILKNQKVTRPGEGTALDWWLTSWHGITRCGGFFHLLHQYKSECRKCGIEMES